MEPAGPHSDMSKTAAEVDAHAEPQPIQFKHPTVPDQSADLEAKIMSNVQLDLESPKAGSSVAIPGMPFSKPAVIGAAGEQERGNPDYTD